MREKLLKHGTYAKVSPSLTGDLETMVPERKLQLGAGHLHFLRQGIEVHIPLPHLDTDAVVKSPTPEELPSISKVVDSIGIARVAYTIP